MTFEKWWNENGYKHHYSDDIKQLAQYAWFSSTAAERQRCREIVEEVASASSIIGIGVANQIAEKIGE